jgi:ADP-ribosylglycohydrolase
MSVSGTEPRIVWTAEGVELIDGSRRWRASRHVFPNGEKDDYLTLAAAAQAAAAEGVVVRRCASCARFRFSGMSRQMSGGGAGYCGRVGFRSQRGVVEIGFVCGEHEPVEGWPGDLEAAQRARLALAEGGPDRSAAYEGAILGLAVGDALGFPAEFRSRRQILEAFGPDGLADFVALHDPRWPERPAILGKRHPAGTFSDDTQMTIAVARALIAGAADPARDLEVVLEAMGAEFVAWSRADDNDRAPGGTCLSGCANLAAGVPPRRAGVPDSKGCGSAMRVAPIGLVYHADRARLLEAARASSLLTHGHPAAIESAAAAALLVSLALDKRPPDEMHEALMREVAPGAPDLARRLGQVKELRDADPAHALSQAGLGEGWVAEEAVASALWCFQRSPDDFARTVLTAANTDGDSDSIATIAGSISGAFNGAAAIPAPWRAGVERSTMLRDLAARLWQARLQP